MNIIKDDIVKYVIKCANLANSKQLSYRFTVQLMNYFNDESYRMVIRLNDMHENRCISHTVFFDYLYGLDKQAIIYVFNRMYEEMTGIPVSLLTEHEVASSEDSAMKRYMEAKALIMKKEFSYLFNSKEKEMTIKNVIFNNPATIVFWEDGTKTIVKCQQGEIFDREKGLAMAIAKKVLGTNESQSNFNDEIKKWTGPTKDITKSVVITVRSEDED